MTRVVTRRGSTPGSWDVGGTSVPTPSAGCRQKGGGSSVAYWIDFALMQILRGLSSSFRHGNQCWIQDSTTRCQSLHIIAPSVYRVIYSLFWGRWSRWPRGQGGETCKSTIMKYLKWMHFFVFLNTPLMYADKKSALKEPVEGEDESFSIAEHVQKGIQPGGGRSRTTSSYCQHFQTQASWTPSERVSSWAQRALWQERCCVFCIYLFKYTVNILLII